VTGATNRQVNMFDPQEFVSRCRQALADPDPAPAVREVVGETVSQPEALQAALDMAAPGPMTWYQSPELTVQRIVWPNGIITPPHEHRMWAVVGVYQGQEDNTLWRRGDNRVEQIGGRELPAGEVLVLDSDAIHAIANPCRCPTIGLHVYGGDIITTPRSEWDFAGQDEHPFDMANVERIAAGLMAKSRELGRDLDFDEVRQACLTTSRHETPD
jgi:predicted metal-dependent enzyme (double-stranded beta helix superfamily)